MLYSFGALLPRKKKNLHWQTDPDRMCELLKKEQKANTLPLHSAFSTSCLQLNFTLFESPPFGICIKVCTCAFSNGQQGATHVVDCKEVHLIFSFQE